MPTDFAEEPCFGVIFSMKVINYAQHYGLRRIRLAGGRFERIKPQHSWSAASKFSNWLFFNMQRHPDHHTAASRIYALLQHHGGDQAPQLPGSYAELSGLALFPKAWFKKMDPLVGPWRAHFYPQVDDWSAYDSPAVAARPNDFEAIAEILGAAPGLAEWMNRAPELLDNLKAREFTDLDLPEGFDPDPEVEAIARQGLARLYWTHELDVSEMKERIADSPVLGVRETVEAVRNWTNDKVFQIGVHTMRGNLTPIEAGIALSNAAEASIASLLSAVEEDFALRRTPNRGAGVAAVVLGDPACGEATPGAQLDVVFVYEGGPAEYYQALCSRFLKDLRAFCRDNLLFAPAEPGREGRAVCSLADFAEYHRTGGSANDLLDLARARCVFASDGSGIARRFEETRREILAHGAARDTLISDLREVAGGAAETGLLSIDEMRGGLRDVENAARFLQLSFAGDVPEVLSPDAVAVFRAASARGLIPDQAAQGLTEAARMWRNLRGVLPLVAVNGFAVETAAPKVQAVVARSCGLGDFGALAAAINETASRATTEIEALHGISPDRADLS